MKHAVLILLTIAVLLSCITPVTAGNIPVGTETVSASDGQEGEVVLQKPLLSPGLAVLAEKKAVIRSGVGGEAICFSSADFEKVLGYAPSEITVLSLPDPAKGVLKIGALDLQAGQTLSARTLSSLRFLPSENTAGQEASFTFTACGGAYETDTALTCRLCMTETENGAPYAKDVSVSAFCAVPVSGCLYASDPDADALTYSVVREPRKGSVVLDTRTGAFVYTPDEGKTGKDVFTCRVTDPYGNESEVCRAEVTIRKPTSDVCYADLDGHWAASPALAMAEYGLMVGENVGGAMLFSPDRPVTRAEFLVTAMCAAGYGDCPACEKTVFADDDDIPAYRKGYLQSAYDRGIVSGAETDEAGNPVFLPDRTVTRAEACVMLERLLGIDTGTGNAAQPVFAPYAEDASVPAWSRNAANALYEAGILSGTTDRGLAMAEPLDRAQTAQLLSMTVQYLEKR